MERIQCFQERWSIGLCACSAETVHFHYGNATLHILAEDLRDLGNALQRLGERLESQKCQDGNGSRLTGYAPLRSESMSEIQSEKRMGFLRIFAMPMLLAIISTVGLLSALLGDGMWDLLSWLGLGVPIGLTFWHIAQPAQLKSETLPNSQGTTGPLS